MTRLRALADLPAHVIVPGLLHVRFKRLAVLEQLAMDALGALVGEDLLAAAFNPGEHPRGDESGLVFGSVNALVMSVSM